MTSAVNLELVETIRSVRFTPVRIREGYAMNAVDELLDQLERSATRGLPLQPLLDGAHFPTFRWREGYDRVEVDEFLVEIGAAAALGTSRQDQ
ncbi:MAG: DivIVA protein [Marmoricola sp.]|nr:DivIVA protein [Marmoricola sp.]